MRRAATNDLTLPGAHARLDVVERDVDKVTDRLARIELALWMAVLGLLGIFLQKYVG